MCPLFIGPSDTVAEFVPNQLRTVAQEYQSFAHLLRLELAPPLVCLCPFIEKTLPFSRRGEGRIAAILYERVRETLSSATPEQLGDGVFSIHVYHHLNVLCLQRAFLPASCMVETHDCEDATEHDAVVGSDVTFSETGKPVVAVVDHGTPSAAVRDADHPPND